MTKSGGIFQPPFFLKLIEPEVYRYFWKSQFNFEL